ncbi:MAG: cobalamin biosynthesis protein CbiX [Nitrosospira sp.]
MVKSFEIPYVPVSSTAMINNKENMNMQKYKSTLNHFYCLALVMLSVAASIKSGFAEEFVSRTDGSTGFLVVAADRGFLGNEEIIDEFQLFAKAHNASLIFVTDERTQKYLHMGVDGLMDKGAARIVVIPLFISAANPRFILARQLLEREKVTVPVSYTRPYGESVFAVEDLVDRFRTIEQPADTNLVVVGYGAVDNDSEERMRADWKRIVQRAAGGIGFSSINVLMGQDKKEGEAEMYNSALKQAMVDVASNGTKTVVVPFHLGPRLDTMMSFDAKLARMIPPGIQLVDGSKSIAAIPQGLATWLQREANRVQPLAVEDIGVVFLSHGSDFNWNETMRDAVRPLMKRYKIEFAFSMADQQTIERAIRKLEQRGAKAAIIVRVFAMEESFRASIERMVGLDIEGVVEEASDAHAGDGHDSHGASTIPGPRIRTSLPIRTVGGLGSSPLFAAVLLDRALALSKNPARDTIILVAHGSGSDYLNERWKEALEEIAGHMRKADGDKFYAIKAATWREDWPDKRAPWIKKIRNMVENARKEGGEAIVIPARTTGQGFEKIFLAGLEYELGSGFAPHPMFVQWVDERVKEGLAQFTEACHVAARIHTEDYALNPDFAPRW